MTSIESCVLTRNEEGLNQLLSQPHDLDELTALVHKFGTTDLSPLWRVNH
jgi:hypothetical protein